MPPVLELNGVSKSYRRGDEEIIALAPTDLIVQRGELVAITGPSGAGKSTLLAIAGLLLPTDTGGVLVLGAAIGDSAAEKSACRATTFGYVFQGFNLLDHLTAGENVLDGLLHSPWSRSERVSAAQQALARVGMSDRARHMPNELSGGEQQRIAIARALVKQPTILLADEPTGNLDAENTNMIVDLLVEAATDTTVLLVTHDHLVARRCERIVTPSVGVDARSGIA